MKVLILSTLLIAFNAHADDAEPETPLGIGIAAGGGVVGFSDSDSSDATKVGGIWEVRGLLGVGDALAVEAAYIGTYNDVDTNLIDADVQAHGFEGLLRVSLTNNAVQPYIVGGAGWMRYSLSVNDTNFNVPGDDDILTLPAGVGVTVFVDQFMIDFRGTYRFAFDDELLVDEGMAENIESLDNWSVTARAGIVF